MTYAIFSAIALACGAVVGAIVWATDKFIGSESVPLVLGVATTLMCVTIAVVAG